MHILSGKPKKTPRLKTLSALAMGLSAGAMMLQSNTAVAGGFGSLINNMFIAAGGPGAYRSQQGMVLQGGYADIKIPNQEYNVISFAPPNLSMGCGGINLFLGSFSFISAQQFVNMLKQIGTGLISVAFYTAISTMCSHCEAILSALQSAMQDMNGLTKGTCTAGAGINLNGIAQSLGSTIGNDLKDAAGFNGSSTGVTAATSANQATPGTAIQQAETTVVNTATNAWNAMTSAVTSPTSPTAVASGPSTITASHSLAGEVRGQGNNTWNALRSSQVQQLLAGVSQSTGGTNSSVVTMELIMSLIGTRITVPPGVAGGAISNAAASLPAAANHEHGATVPFNASIQSLINGGPNALNSQYMYLCNAVSGSLNGTTISYPQYGMASGDAHVNDSCLDLSQGTYASQKIISIQSYVQAMLFGGTVDGTTHTGVLNTLLTNGTLTANQQTFVDGAGPAFYALAIQFQNIDPSYMPNILAQAQPIITATYAVKLLTAVQEVINDAFSSNPKTVQPKDFGSIQLEIPGLIQRYQAVADKETTFINQNKKLLQNVVRSNNAQMK